MRLARLRAPIVAGLVVLGLWGLAALAAWAPAAARAVTPSVAHRVFIVLTTDLELDQVSDAAAPTLSRLLETGTLVGLVPSRQIAENHGISRPRELALTVSAGAWTVPAPDALDAFDSSESVDAATASTRYAQLYGAPSGSADVIFLGQRRAQAAQRSASSSGKLGTLGQAFADAGTPVVAIGNSDPGDALLRRERPAGVAAADRSALVASGRVGRSLLQTDPAAPYGVRTDLLRFADLLSAALQSADGASGPQLVVLDPGDPFRVSRATRESGARPKWDRFALSSLDEVVRLASRELSADDLLMVVSVPTRPVSAGPTGLGVVLLSGREYEGGTLGTSASTRRRGLAIAPDVAATALSAAGLPMPATVLGHAITVPSTTSLGSPASAVRALDARLLAVDAIKYSVITAVSVVVLIAIAAGILAGLVAPHVSAQVGRLVSGAARALLLLAASLPVSTWLAFAIEGAPANRSALARDIAAAGLVMWLVSLAVMVFVSSRAALSLLALGTTAVLVGEQWFGAPLSLSSTLGYSALAAARMYGIGNEAAGLCVGGLLVGVGLLADEFAGRPRVARALVAWVLPVLGTATVLTAAVPTLGANVGVAIWGTFAVILGWWLMLGRRVTWQLAAAIALAIVLIVAGLALIDSGSPQASHLGQAVSGAESRGVVAVAELVRRKAAANLHYLTSTPWTALLLVLFGGLAWAVARPRGPLAPALARNSMTRSAVLTLLATSALAYVTEDSGVVMISTLILFALIATSYVTAMVLSGEGSDG